MSGDTGRGSREASRRFGDMQSRIIEAAPEAERVGLNCGACYVLFRRGVELGVITQADHDEAREHYGRLWAYTGD